MVCDLDQAESSSATSISDGGLDGYNDFQTVIVLTAALMDIMISKE